MIKNPFTACAFLTLLFVMLGMTCATAQQLQYENELFRIQQEHREGKIDAETAVIRQIELIKEIQETDEILKCATPFTAFVHHYKDELSTETLSRLQQSGITNITGKLLQNSYISPSGKFEIHFDTTGSDAVPEEDDNSNGVPDYVEWVGHASDSSYNHEVINIGFKDPILAGSRYKIYIEDDLLYGSYGITYTGTENGTYIVIEADFENFPTNTDPEGNQKGAIKATMAHEFKHAIQYAQNEWAAPSGASNWGEMDATLMEEVVYDDVNDYYNYIKNDIDSQTPNIFSVFGSPHLSVPGSYQFVSWMIYYSEVFGNQLWKEVWDEIDIDHYLGIDEAMIMVMDDGEEDFNHHFIRNHLFHFASGARASLGAFGFDEKENYPLANVEQTFHLVPESKVGMDTIPKLAARYFEILPSQDDAGIIEAAINFDTTKVGLGLLVYDKSGEVSEYVATGENKEQLYIPTIHNWEDVLRVGVVVANYSLSNQLKSLSLEIGKRGNKIVIRDPDYAYIPDQIAVFQNYPNPFNLQTTIHFELPEPSQIKLEVFDILGRKIQTLVDEPRIFGIHQEEFNAAGLSSGVYIYRLQIDEQVFVKKMTLLK